MTTAGVLGSGLSESELEEEEVSTILLNLPTRMRAGFSCNEFLDVSCCDATRDVIGGMLAGTPWPVAGALGRLADEHALPCSCLEAMDRSSCESGHCSSKGAGFELVWRALGCRSEYPLVAPLSLLDLPFCRASVAAPAIARAPISETASSTTSRVRRCAVVPCGSDWSLSPPGKSSSELSGHQAVAAASGLLRRLDDFLPPARSSCHPTPLELRFASPS
mmetsp:Transcript_4357/g.13147  ORF Transcript_4357/g.13147 Transcript_4357/m.13147 type:complete len:220 (-) Transcript_4357:1053-1712(-)|eukprot:scaffold216813_cov31-Tisochrysis_lutea.AAC.8